MSKELIKLSLVELKEKLASGDITSVELTKAYIASIKEQNDEINAYVEVFDRALEDAKKADEAIKKGDIKELTGIPVATKDNILIQDETITAGSHMLDGYKATYDAFVIEQLKKAGAVLIGRTNMDEFAMGASTETSYYGPTKNPRDTTRVPGGSSGGSASAVAMDGATVALGSDTGGSIRQPASFCGVVGMKGTYGSVSRRGIVAMASSLDQVGPFAHSVKDAEILYNVIRGYDKMDSTSIPDEMYEKNKLPKKEKYTIGVPEDFIYTEGVSKDVVTNFKEILKKLEDAGHTIKPVKMPNISYSLAVYYVLMPAEASTNLSRFDGIRYGLKEQGDNLLGDYKKSRGKGFGGEVRRRIMLGTHILSAGYYDAYYNQANKVADLITNDFKKVFEDCDFVVTPTSPTPAFLLGEKTNDPLSMYLADIFTVPVNITGIPAMSVPSGTTLVKDKELPLGFQIMAPHYGEEKMFDLGVIIESLR